MGQEAFALQITSLEQTGLLRSQFSSYETAGAVAPALFPCLLLGTLIIILCRNPSELFQHIIHVKMQRDPIAVLHVYLWSIIPGHRRASAG